MSTAAGGVVTGPVLDPTINPVSPKVIALSTVTLLITALSSMALYLQTTDGSQIYAQLPVWLIVVIRSALTGLSSFFAGYRASDPQRVIDLATSPKVLAGVGIGLCAQIVVDLVAFLVGDGRGLYSNWNPVFVVALSSVLPLIAAAAASFIQPDPARVSPKNLDPEPIRPVTRAEVVASTHRGPGGPGGLLPEGVPGHPHIEHIEPPVDGDPTVHRAT